MIQTVDVEVVQEAPLSRGERDVLKKSELAIEAGLSTFWAVGLALATIRDQQLFRETHATFQAYADERWGINKSYISRLIGAAGTMNNLAEAATDSLPATERHCRPMLSLPPEGQRLAWSLVLDQVGTGKVTSKAVEDAVAVVRSNRLALPPAKAKRERVENDFYPTHDKITAALVKRVSIATDSRIFECCAGDNAIADYLRALFYEVDAADIDPRVGQEEFDATDGDAWSDRYLESDQNLYAQDWTITNPPFKCAVPILREALINSGTGVAFLLPLTFLEPAGDRAELLEEYADKMTHVIPVNPRPQFRDDTAGSDRVTVAWFVWQRAWSWEKQGIPCPFQFLRGWR